MAAAVQRGATSTGSAGYSETATVGRPSGVVAGDLLLAVQIVDASGSYSAMTGPAGWTLVGGLSGAQAGYVKVWRKVATGSEPTFYSFPNGGFRDNSDQAVIVTAWQAGTYDPVAPVSQLTFAAGDYSNQAIAPSVQAETDDRLITAYGMITGSPGTVTTPSGMAMLGHDESGNWTHGYAYTQALTANGLTGTRTLNHSFARPWMAASLVVGSASILANPVETEGLRDVVTPERDVNRRADDPITLAESVIAGFLRTFTGADVAGLTDAMVRTQGKGAADVLGGIDAWSIVQSQKPTLGDAEPIRDQVVTELVRGEVEDYQFLVQTTPVVKFGLGQTVSVSSFDPGSADNRTQDADSPVGDYRMFGTDRKTPPVWAWTMWTDAYNPQEALGWNDLIAQVWDNDVRLDPGGVLPLSYQIAGRRRRVYGRPRRLTSVPDAITFGRIHIAADFALAENVFYDDEEQSVSVSMRAGFVANTGLKIPATVPWRFTTGTAPRTETMRIQGSQKTWATVTITGPVAYPWVQIGGTTIGLSGSVPAGLSITLSGRPWDQGILRSDGAWMPSMLDPRTRLSQLRLSPGEYSVTYGGTDNTGSSRCTVAWRNAYRSL